MTTEGRIPRLDTPFHGALPGTYALLIQLKSPHTIPVGRLGEVELQGGVYAYAGSARGPGGLAGRIRRHLQPREAKRAHWHIDALLAVGELLEVWWSEGAERRECQWAEALATAGRLVLPGFGASDCRCRGHLVDLVDSRRKRRAWRALQAISGRTLNHWSVPGAPIS